MRISNQMIGASVQSNLSMAMERLLELQNQASSGKRILRASDDPLGTGQSLSYRASLASIEQYGKNLTEAKASLGLVDGALSNVNKALQEAKRVALQGANATTSDDQRKALATQVQQQIDSIVQEVNATHLDRRVFGGFETGQAPVAVNPSGSTPPYVYNGDDGVTRVQVNESTSIVTSVTAAQILNFGGAADASAPDLLTTLCGLRDALSGNDQAAIQTRMKELDAGAQNVIALRGEMGAHAQQVEVHTARLAETKSTVEEQLSQVENVDITDVLTRLQSEQNAYQAALIATTKITQLSLADYLK